MDPVAELRIDGLVEHSTSFTFADLDGFPGGDRVEDVSQIEPSRQGVAVTLDALLSHVRPLPDADYLTFHASRDDFAASVPLEAVRAEGLLIYKQHGCALPVERGGPFRFLIRDSADCRIDELDECANVKFVDRIELSRQRGRDTRPTTDAEHAQLHEQQSSDR